MWPITSTIDATELLWTTFAFIALLYQRRGFIDAHADLAALVGAKRNSVMIDIAVQNIEDDAVMAFVQGGFAIIGVVAMFKPSAPSAIGAIGVLILLGAEAALVYLSWKHRVLRRRLLRRVP